MPTNDRPQFRRGLQGLRRAQDESDIQLRHNILLIRHLAESSGWPEPARAFAQRVGSYFPDVEDRAEWPDWTADDILGWIIEDLATALQEPSES